MSAIPHKLCIQRLYKRALRNAYDHYAFEREIYRQHCLLIRSRFEANKDETNVVRIKALVKQAEDELEEKKHPRPHIFPTSFGGTKHYRNFPPSLWLVEHGEGNWKSDEIEWVKI
jgi:NADH dehydrogenase (ubiquinone) 1 beta subcomplex subunit 9